MVGRDKLDCVPLFLGELADDIFVCGKTINLLKLCCPGVSAVLSSPFYKVFLRCIFSKLSSIHFLRYRGGEFV